MVLPHPLSILLTRLEHMMHHMHRPGEQEKGGWGCHAEAAAQEDGCTMQEEKGGDLGCQHVDY